MEKQKGQDKKRFNPNSRELHSINDPVALQKLIEEEIKVESSIDNPAVPPIVAATFVNGLTKYTEEVLVKFWCHMFTWFVNHENAVFLEEYYLDPFTDKSVPWGSLRVTMGRYKSCTELHESVKKILEIRLVKAALEGRYKEGMAKFFLSNKYGYTEKTQQDITLSTKTIEYKFQNPELQEPDKIDEDKE